ncbi:MAG TPA: glutathione S-transferase N-terminal domain-containing protein [Alphaproteobacteria bacterium]|nr:glutathione S-transferase N-terminal domain-containing protein [Alphaproteobacteria bacterium]
MIQLYGMSSPNVQKIQLMLEETGLAYRICRVDVWKGENFTPEFEAMNPNRKVPVIIDEDGPEGEPCTIFESGAILIYLAEKTGKFLPAKGAARYAALEWLAVQMCAVGPMFGQYTHFRMFAPKGNEYAESRYRTQAARVFDALEARLGQVPYLGGADYTIADIATFPWMRDRSAKWGGDWSGWPNVWAWFDRVAQRPAVKKTVEEMNRIWAEDLTSINAAPPALVDRILGRGEYAR